MSMFMINNACSAPLPSSSKYKRLFILVSGGGQGGPASVYLSVNSCLDVFGWLLCLAG